MISTDINSLRSDVPVNPRKAIGQTLFTTERYPLYYRMITKCGCTFALNVLYHLNYGHVNADPISVHDDPPVIPWALDTSNEDITNSPYAFVIVRNPVKRFMSLYFDKLYGLPRNAERAGLRGYFIENGLVDPEAGTDPVRHRDNCMRSIQWIGQNLKGLTDQEKNFHWKPQRYKLNQIKSFKFHVLQLEGIDFQLSQILKPLVPHIEDVIKAVSAQNVSQKPAKPKDILNDELRQMITDTYRGDTRIYREVSKYWRDYKEEY